jgi:hypothetical protein
MLTTMVEAVIFNLQGSDYLIRAAAAIIVVIVIIIIIIIETNLKLLSK